MVKKFIAAMCICLAHVAIAQNAATQANVATIDLDLDKAIELALADNPTIWVADKEIELKQVANEEAWQNLLPNLSANLSLQHSIQVAAIKTAMGEFKMGMDGSTTAVGGLALNLPIFAPAVYQNMKLTKEDIQLAQEKARGSRLDLINQVTKAYYSVLLAKDSRDVMQRSLKVAEENYETVNNMYEVGRASEYDRLSADVQKRSMNSALISAQAGLELATLQLKVLMGVTENIGFYITDNLNNYKDKLTVEDSGSLALELDNNTNLRQLDMNVSLLQRARRIMNSKFIPTIGFQATYQYQSYSNDHWNIFKYKYSPSSTVAFSVSIPIFTASNWTKLKTNTIQQAQLRDTRDYTRNQLAIAVESYRSNMLSSVAQVESNLIAIEQADKAVAISSKRYEIGNGTILELNQSETALTQAQLTYNQSIYEYLTNKADLDYTLGRGVL